jgi:hypothetical protein
VVQILGKEWQDFEQGVTPWILTSKHGGGAVSVLIIALESLASLLKLLNYKNLDYVLAHFSSGNYDCSIGVDKV